MLKTDTGLPSVAFALTGLVCTRSNRTQRPNIGFPQCDLKFTALTNQATASVCKFITYIYSAHLKRMITKL